MTTVNCRVTDIIDNAEGYLAMHAHHPQISSILFYGVS